MVTEYKMAAERSRKNLLPQPIEYAGGNPIRNLVEPGLLPPQIDGRMRIRADFAGFSF
jgi:hypothetical protein